MASAPWASNPWVWAISFRRLGPDDDVWAGKESPILFRGEMVRAILEGRKTQTRRVCTLNIVPTDQLGDEEYDGPQQFFVDARHQLRTPMRHGSEAVPCPYGKPGDRLWVRESARVSIHGRPGHVRLDYLADGMTAVVPWPERLKPPRCGRRVPNGVHREGARLILEVTDVRVERLQDISEEDAKAEGIEYVPFSAIGAQSGHGPRMRTTAAQAFGDLWESLHG